MTNRTTRAEGHVLPNPAPQGVCLADVQHAGRGDPPGAEHIAFNDGSRPLNLPPGLEAMKLGGVNDGRTTT
jgi:hypothetical protein